jgi:hypothetical protein
MSKRKTEQCGLSLDTKGGGKLDKSLKKLNFYSIFNQRKET